MTTRAGNRRSVREGLDMLRAMLRARDAEPVPDLDRLTVAERSVWDGLMRTVDVARERGDEHPLRELTYEQLCEARALRHKATDVPADARDADILATIKAQGG